MDQPMTGASAWALAVALAASGCLSDLVPTHANKGVSGADAGGTPAVDAGSASMTSDDAGGPPAPDLAQAGPDLATPPFTMRIEAESGTLTDPMAAADDANASGVKYVVVAAGLTGGKAVYNFTVPVAGDYYVWGRYIAPGDANNSFHVSMDTDTVDNDASDAVSTIWDLPIQTAWTWIKVNMRIDAVLETDMDLTFKLSAGAHVLYVNEREDSSQLDALVVTNDPKMVPTN
jgi:hypothetical protein